MIYGPDGAELTERIPMDQDGFVIAEVDLQDRDMATRLIDVVDHYSRPGLLSLNITRESAVNVRYV
jgi:nitrilase